jgi:hypothetical protein
LDRWFIGSLSGFLEDTKEYIFLFYAQIFQTWQFGIVIHNITARTLHSEMQKHLTPEFSSLAHFKVLLNNRGHQTAGGIRMHWFRS